MIELSQAGAAGRVQKVRTGSGEPTLAFKQLGLVNVPSGASGCFLWASKYDVLDYHLPVMPG